MNKDGIKISHSGDIFIEMKKDAFNITSKAPFTVSQGSAPGNSITMDDNGIVLQDKNLNKLEMAAAGITIQALPPAGVTLGTGAGGFIACVGTNMVATMLGPQPIIPGPGANVFNKS
jgi:hypothetical protein